MAAVLRSVGAVLHLRATPGQQQDCMCLATQSHTCLLQHDTGAGCVYMWLMCAVLCFGCLHWRRKDCEVLSEKLNNAGITAAYYHADMEPGTRAASHSAWSEGHVKVRLTPCVRMSGPAQALQTAAWPGIAAVWPFHCLLQHGASLGWPNHTSTHACSGRKTRASRCT